MGQRLHAAGTGQHQHMSKSPLLHLPLQALDVDAWLLSMDIERDRPERMVHDVEISAGYMHSG